MDMNKLTQKSQEALQEAQSVAQRHGHTEADGEHLLLALLDQADGLVPRLLDAGRRGRRQPARRPSRRSSAKRPKVTGPGRHARPGLPHPAAGAGCSTRPNARPSGSRTNTSRSSTWCWPLLEEGRPTRGRAAAHASTA